MSWLFCDTCGEKIPEPVELVEVCDACQELARLKAGGEPKPGQSEITLSLAQKRRMHKNQVADYT